MSRPAPTGKHSPRAGPPLSVRAAYLLSQIGRSQAKGFAERLQPLGLRPKQFALLNLIGLDEGCSQQQLGDRLAVEASGLVRTIDELEQQGILERHPDPSDRRRHALYLTHPGKAKLTRARQAAAQRADEFLAPLSQDEQRVLHNLLARVAGSGDPTADG